MSVRFVVWQIDKNSQRSLGIFHAAFGLRDYEWLHPYEEEHVEELKQWFDAPS